jgi:hypothetical protein
VQPLGHTERARCRIAHRHFVCWVNARHQLTIRRCRPVIAPPDWKIVWPICLLHNGLTPELRHRHRGLSLAAMMMFKFHGRAKTEGAVAVARSDFVRPRLSYSKQLIHQ